MSMTKKHFEALAEALRGTKPNDPAGDAFNGPATAAQRIQWRITVRAVADVCYRSNPAFNRDRFYRACNYEETL